MGRTLRCAADERGDGGDDSLDGLRTPMLLLVPDAGLLNIDEGFGILA